MWQYDYTDCVHHEETSLYLFFLFLDEDSQRRPQETDSAHNVDEKFKQILRKRSGTAMSLSCGVWSHFF